MVRCPECRALSVRHTIYPDFTDVIQNIQGIQNAANDVHDAAALLFERYRQVVRRLHRQRMNVTVRFSRRRAYRIHFRGRRPRAI